MTDTLGPADLRRYAEHLQRLRTDLLEEMTELEREALGSSEHPVEVQTEADSGVEEQDLDLTLLEHDDETLREIVEALGRIQDGSYGRCEACGTAIVASRLDVIPYARHCRPCAEARD